MELKPYQEGMQDGERHHYLSNKELKQYLAMSAKELWKLYNDIDDRGLYAPDVPHISIHTKNGIIPPEYLKEIKKANSNMISNLLKWSNTFYKLASELSSLEARKILGIEENDKLEDIRQKYKALSKKHHPDVGGDPAIQSKINEAYKIILLTNPERKNLDGILVNINQSDPSARDHRMTGFSKSFTNPVEARNFIIEYVGDPPADFGNFGRPYAVSEDGQTKVTIDGITWKDLFPNESFWWTEEDFEVFEKEYEQDRHSFNTMVENNPGAFSDEMADELQRLKQERKNKIPKNRRLEEIAGGASEREIMNQRHRLEKARLPPEEDDGILF
jgi:curved DNA-binding protein CbpA